ncbi:unnamed protein product, partial [Amoebophrya sp. A120]|eukprot:GSA120T00021285001.1
MRASSWNTYKSPLLAWGRFCDSKGIPHFPVKSIDLQEFVALAQNEQTARSYKSAITKA